MKEIKILVPDVVYCGSITILLNDENDNMKLEIRTFDLQGKKNDILNFCEPKNKS